MRFIQLIPLLAAFSDLASALPQSKNIERAQDAMTGPDWSKRMDTRVDQFRGMFDQRNGKGKGLRPPSERKLDDKVDKFQGSRKEKQAGPASFAKRSEITPGAASVEGFFRFSEQCLGRTYCPGELHDLQERLDNELATLSKRQPGDYDLEFLNFAGLKIEDVTPSSRDVLNEEAKAQGLTASDLALEKRHETDICTDFTQGMLPPALSFPDPNVCLQPIFSSMPFTCF